MGPMTTYQIVAEHIRAEYLAARSDNSDEAIGARRCLQSLALLLVDALSERDTTMDRKQFIRDCLGNF